VQKRNLKVGLEINGKKIFIEVKNLNFFGKISGLMFTRREKARALFFDFGKSTRIAIHSFFVFFPFYAIWLDDKNKIVEIRKVYSWKPHIKPKKNFFKLIEIPINDEYAFIFEFLDDDEKDLKRK